MAGCRRAVTEPLSVTRLARLAAFLALGAGGGWLAQRVGTPLPWMIGPLLVTAALCLSGVLSVKVPDRLRPFGQVVVAAQVGLMFTPDALAGLVALGPVILATALATLVCILGVAWALSRLGGGSLAQAFLSSVPTSPVEAAAMAVRGGLDPAPVIVAQTLRLSAVVLVLPLTIYAIDGWPADRSRPVSGLALDPGHIALLLAIGFAAMFAFRKLRIPNPNFLGPIAVMALLAATGNGPAPFPDAVLSAAQVVLGCWLGSTFRRELLGSAGRLAIEALGATLALLAACSAAAVGVAWAFGLDWRLLVLGAAPGGVAEMVLTAKFLGQDVPAVTAFHVARIFIFMPNIPWIVALLLRLERRAPPSKETR